MSENTQPAHTGGSPLARRQALSLAGIGLLAATLAACGNNGTPAVVVPERSDGETLTTKDARERLIAGNDRFVKGTPAHPDESLTRRKGLATAQKPFAAILSCADSRVPPEIVFDQGLGDLFVVRSAGEVVDSAVLGTLQYGVSELAVPLLVVLGHTGCGAVQATIDALEKKSKPTGTALDALVAAIAPSVREAEEVGSKGEGMIDVVVPLNVEKVVESLLAAKVLGPAVKRRELKILGALYDVEAGTVEFL